MIRKILRRLGKTSAEENAEEWKFETTIAENLEAIADLIGKDFPEHLLNKSWEFPHRGTFEFNTKGVRERDVRKAFKLDSLELDTENGQSLWWKADYIEYKKVYRNKNMKYANELRELAKEVLGRFDNSFYYYTFCKYEDSIFTVKNTLQEATEDKKEIDPALLNKAKEIILRFAQALKERVEEEREIENLQKEAVSKSLKSRLDDEIDFIDKYIEVQ